MNYVYVVGGGINYYRPFSSFGQYTSDISILKKPEKISLVLFTGGEDINPVIYNQACNPLTRYNSNRDIYEINAYATIKKLNLPIVGICRGAQLLCALSGGTLFQHVNNHQKPHEMELFDGRKMFVSSTHHQMQNPSGNFEILGWASPSVASYYIGEYDDLPEPEKEPEIVFYPKIRALAIQYHPEALTERAQGFNLPKELVENYLLKNKS